MVKPTQTIRRQKSTNCLGVFDHFVGLVLKGLILEAKVGDISNNPTKSLITQQTNTCSKLSIETLN